jgi:hypothetical protein
MYAQQPPGNRGMYFDGVDDHVSINTLLDVNLNFTIEAWVKIYETISPGQILPILDKNNGVGGYSFYIRENSGSAQLVLWMNGGTGSSFSNFIPMANFADKKWHHIAVTRALSGTINFYLDGVNIGSVFSGVTILTVTTTAYIGKRGTNFFKGQIDEVRFFTSQERTAVQINTDKNAVVGDNLGAEYYWAFEQGTGQTVNNTGTNGISGDGVLGVGGSPESSDPLWALRVKNTSDTGSESLRGVITDANGLAGMNYIDFSTGAGTQTISVTSPLLPTITDAVILDGNSKEDYALFSQMIRIDNAGSLTSGLVFSTGASNSIIRGLQITNFSGQGISISNANNVQIINNVISNNAINITISSADGTSIKGNRVGTDLAGNASFGTNNSRGIDLNTGAVNTIIGGVGEGNLISGNASGGNGIRIQGGNNSIIYGNLIGVNASRTAFIPNSTGIAIATGQNNIIGGLAAGQANIIAGNEAGIAYPGGTPVVGNTYIGNEIYCNTSQQMTLSGGNNNQQPPVITSANNLGNVSGTGVTGDVIHLYKNPSGLCNASSTQLYLGTTTVAGGTWSMSGLTIAAGDVIVATQTNAANGSSGYSATYTVTSSSNIFYTIGNATWNANGNWSDSDGGPDCGCNPSGVVGADVHIQAGHTATVPNATDIGTSNTIDVQGTLTLQNGNTNSIATLTTTSSSIINILAGNFNLLNPTATTINGTVNRQSTGSFPNGLTFADGSIYNHAHDGGVIPSATWMPNSNCNITGVTNNVPTGFAGQNFGNLTWDCTNQQTYAAFNANFNIQGTLRVENTRNGGTPLGLAVSNSGNFTVTTKDFIMNNPTPNSAAFYPYGGTNAADVGTLEVTGDLTIITQSTGVLSGIGKSRILFTGSNNSTFNYHGSFTFYSDAVWEVEVAKTGGQLSFTSPINYIGFEPASGTPVSILKITSGEAVILDNQNLSVGVIEGNATLSMLDNSSLYLRNPNSLFNNTFTGTLNAISTARVFYDSPVNQNIFLPTTGNYPNVILSNSGNKSLIGNITLIGNWMNNATGTFNAGTHTVTFAGASGQGIGGSSVTEFYRLNINNDVNLAVNTRLKEILNIANDKYLVLNDNDFIALNGSSISGGINKYIVTNAGGFFVYRNESGVTQSGIFVNAPLGRFSPIQYASIILPIDGLANGQEVRIRALTQGEFPAPTITSANKVGYVWEVILPAGASVNTSSNATLSYSNSVIGTMASNGRAYYHNGTNWVAETTSSSDNSSTVFTPSAFSGAGTRYYGAFAESTDFYTLDNSAVWNVNSNSWSNDGTTPCNCSPNGVANAHVRIRHHTAIPIGSNVDAGAIINIENPVILTTDIAFTASQLSGVAGSKLTINGYTLPTITTNTFITTAGTTIEFASATDGTIPNTFGGNNYQSLRLSGAGFKSVGGNITIQGELSISGGSLVIAGDNITVNGSTTITSGATFVDNATGGVNTFNGVINNAGVLSAVGGNTNTTIFNFNDDITNTGGAILNLDCNCPYNFNKTVSPPLLLQPGGQMFFGSNGAGSGSILSDLTIGDGAAVAFNITTAASLLIANDRIVVNNNSTVGVIVAGNGNINGANANSTWRQGPGAMLYYESDSPMMPVGIFDAVTNTNTVFYNRFGDQVLRATTYHSMVLAGSGIKSVGTGNIVVNTNFAVPIGITFQVNGDNFTSQGALMVEGTWIDGQTGGTNAFNNTVTVTGTGTMTVSGVNTSFFIFAGNITNQGVFNLQDSSQWRLNANLTIQNQSANEMSFAQANSGTGQVNGNITILDGVGNVAFYTNVGSPISGGGTITNQLGNNGLATGRRLILERCQVPVTNAINAVIEYRGGTDITSKTLTADNNTFVYTLSVPSITGTFHHILFTNNSTSSLGGNIVVAGNLGIDSGSTLDAVTHNINVRGNWFNNGTFTAGTTGRVTFDGTLGLQTIDHTFSSPFNILEIANTNHVQINNPIQSSSIVLTSGRLQVGDNDLTLTANPATAQFSQTFTGASTSYIETNGSGRLIRNNLQIGTAYVFPVGDATSIRHLSITPSTIGNASANFTSPISPNPPGGSVDIAAGMWLLSGVQGVVNFENTGCTTNNARVSRLNAGTWDATGITTTAATPSYTTNSIDFSAGQTYTLFAPAAIIVAPVNANLPNGQFGATYTLPFSATGGTAPYSFAVTAGSLPPGLILDAATGVLDGTLSLAGTYTFTITATDFGATTGSQNYQLVVEKAPQQLILPSFFYQPNPDGSYTLNMIATSSLPVTFFSTNTDVAQVNNGNILIISAGETGEADILAVQTGDGNYFATDTVLVMRINRFGVISAFNPDLESKIQIYPNPTVAKTWIQTGFAVKSVRVYNALGQMQNVVWYEQGSQIELETTDWAKGVYFLHIETPQGVVVKRLSKL